MDLHGKKVLLIGSGQDLNGCALAECIDSPLSEWDYVARVNAFYGKPEDVGTRIDIAFAVKYYVYDRNLLSKCTPDTFVVIFDSAENCEEHYRSKMAQEIGVNLASSGVSAVHWLLDRGAAQVDIIGFAHPGGHPMHSSGEKYYWNGAKDSTKHTDWEKEIAWIKKQKRATLL